MPTSERVAHAEVYVVHRGLVLDDALKGMLQLVAEAYGEVAHVDNNDEILVLLDNCDIISQNNGFLLILHRIHLSLSLLYALVGSLKFLVHTLALGSGAH